MLSSRKNNLLFILFFLVEIAFSQQFPSRNFSTIDGLPNNSVYSIYKDSRGILWVGTANGLSAIKNEDVKNYDVSDGLAHNSCWAITEDENYNMWFGSHGGGLTVFDGKKFKILNYKNGLIHDKIRRLFIHKNLLYVGTEFGISVLDVNSKKIIFSKKIIGLRKLFQVMGFVEINSEVYFGTFNDGFWKVDLKTKNIKLVNHKQPDIFSIYKKRDSLFICHGDAINEAISRISVKDYLGNKNTNTHFGTSVFWNFVTDKRGITYVAGNGINFATGGIYKIIKNRIINLNDVFGVESSEVWSLFYDSKFDNLYVGTINKGLYKIDLTQQIKYYSASNFNKSKLDIVSIANFQKENLILHKTGLIFFKSNEIQKEISNQKFYEFAQQSFRTKPQLRQFEYFSSFSKTSLTAFEFRGLKIVNSIIWINSTIGLFGLNNKGIIEEYYPYSSSAFDFESPNKIIFQVAYGRFCTAENFKKSSAYKEYESSNLNNPKEAFAILKNHNKYFIISSSNGLYSYKNGKFNSYYFNNIWKENELVQAKINDNKELVIANSSGDIFIIDVSKGFKIQKKIDREELTGNSISFLECYKDILFIGTERGLNIYKNGNIRLIDEEQGLKGKVFTSSDIDGTILRIGTQDGYYEYDFKDYIRAKNNPVKLKITGIEVNFEKINQTRFEWLNYNSDKIELPYNKNTISIAFEPQSVQHPNKLEYRYKLFGLGNSNWSKWTKDKNINLTYLPNGNYKIRLQVKDLYFGQISSNDILKIVITPPFWKTWWFLLSCFIFIIVCGYFVYSNRIRTIKKQERAKSEVQKRLEETKMEALQSQMNPHFIFNAMNSIQNYIIDNNTDDALMYMGEFSKIIRQTLNNSSIQRISLSDEIEYLQSYVILENMRFKNQISFELIVDEELDLFEIEIPPMLIQPFIENVFVHAFDSQSIIPKVVLSFKQNENMLYIEIRDNGKGMISGNLNKLNTSKGINLAKERISLFQPNNLNPISIFSEPGKGTKILVSLQI